MAFDVRLADRIREFLSGISEIEVEEKKMFGGLGFMVNDKMCINVSGNKIMCRYDPALWEIVGEKAGHEPMIMKGKELKGYCYVNFDGYDKNEDFRYWLHLCLEFNKQAKSSKKNKRET